MNFNFPLPLKSVFIIITLSLSVKTNCAEVRGQRCGVSPSTFMGESRVELGSQAGTARDEPSSPPIHIHLLSLRLYAGMLA